VNAKGEVLLQLFNNNKLRNETKTFLEPKFFSIVKFKKSGFSAPLNPLWNIFYLNKGLILISIIFDIFYLNNLNMHQR